MLAFSALLLAACAGSLPSGTSIPKLEIQKITIYTQDRDVPYFVIDYVITHTSAEALPLRALSADIYLNDTHVASLDKEFSSKELIIEPNQSTVRQFEVPANLMSKASIDSLNNTSLVVLNGSGAMHAVFSTKESLQSFNPSSSYVGLIQAQRSRSLNNIKQISARNDLNPQASLTPLPRPVSEQEQAAAAAAAAATAAGAATKAGATPAQGQAQAQGQGQQGAAAANAPSAPAAANGTGAAPATTAAPSPQSTAGAVGSNSTTNAAQNLSGANGAAGAAAAGATGYDIVSPNGQPVQGLAPQRTGAGTGTGNGAGTGNSNRNSDLMDDIPAPPSSSLLSPAEPAMPLQIAPLDAPAAPAAPAAAAAAAVPAQNQQLLPSQSLGANATIATNQAPRAAQNNQVISPESSLQYAQPTAHPIETGAPAPTQAPQAAANSNP